MRLSRYQYHNKPAQKSPLAKIKSIAITGLLTFGIGFISYELINVFTKRYSLEKEKQAIQKEIQTIEQKSLALESIKEYIMNPSYQEKEAKSKLDLNKPGEQVIKVTPQSIVANASSEELVSILHDPNSEERIPAQTNIEKWLAFFFSKGRL